jgi:hypothetical protein
MITKAKGRPIPTLTPTIKTHLESQSVLAGDSCDDMLLSIESPEDDQRSLLVQVKYGA